MNAELILEIGTEEIPSGYIDRALHDLKQLAQIRFESNRIKHSGLKTYGTPRRIVLVGHGIADKQDDLEQEFNGPPRNVAYDKKGNPTKAALGFAKKHGVSVNDLDIVKTPKGEYLHVNKLVPGRPTSEILAEILPDMILAIPWPKSMRWGNIDCLFVRPIHWILCLLNGKVVPFELGGIKTDSFTRGHRFMSPDPMEIRSVSDYFTVMDKSFVMVDHKKRQQSVKASVETAAANAGGKVIEDVALLNTVTNLVEYPFVVSGSFGKKFLSLPEAVLITSMREHQKYFAMYDDHNHLMSRFVAVNNTRPRDKKVVIKGHERVLKARLADAVFFFREDRSRSLLTRLEDLKDVVYQADLGTSFDKVVRFKKLAQIICDHLDINRHDEIRLAADLCKCDLVTQMVSEFPGLQGVIGKEYAKLEGFPDEVCAAIEEHYMPVAADSVLPETEIGAILGIADRIDTITGCFAVNLIPSGSSDPFALRRHALAVIRILEDRDWPLSLKKMLNEAILILKEQVDFDSQTVLERVMDFFRERYRFLILRAGYDSDIVESVISVAFDTVNDLRKRIDQMKRFAVQSKEFNELALTFKRVSNILKNQEKQESIDTSIFREESEVSLWKTYTEVKNEVEECLKKRDYYGAMVLMAHLKAPVDNFFDNVEVLTKADPHLKNNRVAMLQQVETLLKKLADFSKFSI